MAFCLAEKQQQRFIQALKSGEITPEKLEEVALMSSEKRRKWMSQYVGEDNAREVNKLFESKLLLKNQQRGMITWAKKLAGVNKRTLDPTLEKINKLKRAIAPEEGEELLEDIVRQRLGIQIDEALGKKIVAITDEMQSIFDEVAKTMDNPSYDDVMNKIREPNSDIGKKYITKWQELRKLMRDNVPTKIIDDNVTKAKYMISESFGFMRTLKVGWDVYGAPFRQGVTYIGRRQWNDALRRTWGYFKDPGRLDDLEIAMLSHHNYDLAYKYKRQLGLTMFGEKLTQKEETFMSDIVKHIPWLKNSEAAYIGFLNDLRFNRFVDMIDHYEKVGINIKRNPEMLEQLATTIAAGTGRGYNKKLDHVFRATATALFAPRLYAARIQTFTKPLTMKGPARQEALKNLATLMGIISAGIGLQKMMGRDVETDMRSADFGKIKVDNTRIDITGGYGSFLNLFARMATTSTKSSTTGKVYELNTGKWSDSTVLELIGSFITNKASPQAAFFRDWAKGETFEGKPIGLALDQWDEMGHERRVNLAKHLFNQLIVPLPFETAIDTFNKTSEESRWWMAPTAVGLEVFGGLGISTYGYVPQGKDFEKMQKEKGQKVFDEAVKELNINLNKALSELSSTVEYISASQEDKNKKIDRVIRKEKSKILRKYQ